MSRVFLSYGGPDKAFARRLKDAMSIFGIDCFFFPDHAPPGQKLHRLMRDEVTRADHVVLICSQLSLDRLRVRNEIEETLQREAREGGRPILIPITIDNYIFSDWLPEYPGLAQAIRDRVIADFRGTKGNRTKFSQAVERLAVAITAASEPGYLTENIRGAITVEILDPGGHKARLLWERWFIVRSSNVDKLQLRDVTASGGIRVVSTNLGRLVEPSDEGGRQTIYTLLDHPLEMGRIIHHVIEMEATDSYTQSKESSTFDVSAPYQEILLKVVLPPERPVQTAAAWRVHGGRRAGCSELQISGDAVKLDLLVLKQARF